MQLRRPDFTGGANRPSLIEAQHNYRQTAASDPRFVANVRPAGAAEPVDPDWRPFDPARDRISERETGTGDRPTDQVGVTAHYYWRT